VEAVWASSSAKGAFQFTAPGVGAVAVGGGADRDQHESGRSSAAAAFALGDVEFRGID